MDSNIVDLTKTTSRERREARRIRRQWRVYRRRSSPAIVIGLYVVAIITGLAGVAILESLPCQDRWDIRITRDCFYDSDAIRNEEMPINSEPRQ